MARVSLGPRKAQCGKPPLKSDWTEDWEMPNGQCSFLLSKFTISLGLSLTTALSCLTLTILNGNLPNLFDLSKCLTDPTFLSLIQDSWKASELIPSASSSLSRFLRRLEALTVNIRLWNKTHFGNLFQRKTRLLARLRGIQLALAKKPSAFLYSLEHQLT